MNGNVAAALVLFVALGTAVFTVNLLNHHAALMLATDGGSDALALFFLDLHGHGYNVAQVYFGLWLLPLGYLAYRSGYFPRVLGALLMVAAGTHLVEVLTHLPVIASRTLEKSSSSSSSYFGVVSHFRHEPAYEHIEGVVIRGHAVERVKGLLHVHMSWIALSARSSPSGSASRNRR